MNLEPGDTATIAIFYAAVWIPLVWMYSDILKYPIEAWVDAGESRLVWLVMAGPGFVFLLWGLVCVVTYVFRPRPKLQRFVANSA